ncbi:MAG: metallophosphoesterase [Lachnospiraceae bacterium]|nr:metallophosphoesterase [Lachnospiraceae bacterium]
MKFIHMADVHLGVEPEAGTNLGINRKQEIWDAFEDVLKICDDKKVDLLLIPGDLFHGQPSYDDADRVMQLFGALKFTKVVMIAGNHDCLLNDSAYHKVKIPSNVRFLTDRTSSKTFFNEINTEIFGLSYEQEQISEPRYDDFRPDNLSHINILLAHGNVHGGDKSIPIHLEILSEAGFDYIALGHLHTRIEISGRIAYTGGFEPFLRTEVGQKGYIEGEIIKDNSNISRICWKFVSHAKRQYIHHHIEVTPDMDETSICDLILNFANLNGLQHMYIVKLIGAANSEVVLNLDFIMEYVQKHNCNLVELQD